MRAEGPPGVPKEDASKPPGSRSLKRHGLFLQQDLHLNPNGVWLKPCGMRLYIPFKSPLFIKYTLQLQYSRYPHFHQISPPTQLKCGAMQWVGISHFSSLDWSAAAEGWTRLQITRGRQRLSSPQNRDLELQPWVGHRPSRMWWDAAPELWAAQGGRETHPKKVLGLCLGPEECSALNTEPSSVQGTGICCDTGAAGRGLYVMFTSSKCISRQKHLL